MVASARAARRSWWRREVLGGVLSKVRRLRLNPPEGIEPVGVRTALVTLVLALAACTPETVTFDASVSGPAPAAPQLTPLPAVVTQSSLTLTGEAPSGTTVRLFGDDACAGPTLAVTSPEALAAGVEVELTREVDSAFTADAVSGRGVRSPCSEAVHVRFHIPPAPLPPTISSVTPDGPSRDDHFVLRGYAPGGTLVRAWAHGCRRDLLGSATPEDFADGGLEVTVDCGLTVGVQVDAVDGVSAPSQCSSEVSLLCDRTPPAPLPTLRSPTPGPETSAWVSLKNVYEVAHASFFLNGTCSGAPVTTCDAGQCGPRQLAFPPSATTNWSVVAEDALGNSTGCLFGDAPYTNDPQLPPSSVQLQAFHVPSPEYWVTGQVPADRTAVWVYDDDSCTHLVATTSVVDLLVFGLYLQVDAGVLTANAPFEDGGVGPCSAPTLLP